eukprot:TRINITY_DN45915_c0_g1_i1.p1 TRINITY_DN45915_c0_g1~~TRINITY_DN45915_c0_g1_i1.p1  ORF type:complete len:262 (+),score=41.52 TRINITY_DN45915_c0_g1_i1:73-786(+)
MDTSQLVERVKSLCRSDSAAKQAWCNWCDASQNGTKDPSRMDETALISFFTTYMSGAGMSPGPTTSPGGQDSKRSAPQPRNSPVPGQPELAEAVKLGQRMSPSWKAAWARYAEVNGNGLYDPAKHPKDFLVSFFELLGSQAGVALGVASEGDEGDVTPTYPPAKRLCTGQVEAQLAASEDERQVQLAKRVKDLQKTDRDKKVLWSEYCDDYGGGVKDPSRHTTSSLENFFAFAGETV